MSKNTGTSELINYFDLGVNGDVGIAGSLDINTIANATTDTDTFLVSDTGIIKYRTGAQLLSDIGAAPATGGSYLPLTGGILTGTTRMDGSGGTVPSITMIYNSGVNRLLAPLLRLYGATNEASNYIELFGSLATSNRTINFPDASGTVALTSNLSAYLPLTGGTLTGALGGTTANFSSNVTMGGNDSAATRLYVRTEDTANTPSLTLFKNISSASSEDIFRVQSWNGAFNTVASIRANGSANFLSSVSATSLRSSTVGTFGFNTASNGEFQIYSEAGGGLVMAGRGATYDMVITNKAGADTIRIPTGTTNANFVGNVLIGTTTNPYNVASLVVNHNSTFARTYFQRGVELIEIVPSDGTAANFISSSYTASGSAYKPLAFSGRQNPADLYLLTSGNVAIGATTDNGARLRVNGSGWFDGALTMNAYSFASSAIQFTRAATNVVGPASGNGILVFAGGNAQMRMDTNNSLNFDMNNGGNPHTALSIRQNGNAVSVNSPDNNLMLELRYQNVASGYLGAIGSALYGYSVNGGYALLNSSSAWVPASDIKRKRNFEDYNLGLDAILGLKPKYYHMDFQKDGDEKQVGLVAQEVRDFIPLAYEENADFIGINYNAVIVTMVKAIQEQQQQIQELKNKLS